MERFLFATFVVLLALVPLYFGSDGTLAWALNALGFGGLLAITSLYWLVQGKTQPIGFQVLGVPVLLVIGVVAWMGLQIATQAPAALHAPLWGTAADALGVTEQAAPATMPPASSRIEGGLTRDRSPLALWRLLTTPAERGGPIEGSITVNRDRSFVALVRLLTCLAVFWTAVQLCASPRRGLALVRAVAAIGVAYACYGLAAALWTPDRVLWADKAASGVVTSTFLSPDAYAAYAGLGLLALIGLAVRPERRGGRPDSAAPASQSHLVRQFGVGQGARLLLGLLLATALVLTVSWAAIVATACGIYGVVALLKRPQSFDAAQKTAHNPKLTRRLVGAFGIACLLTFVLAWGGGAGTAGTAAPSWTDFGAASLRAILDHPLLGFGAATAPDVVPWFWQGQPTIRPAGPAGDSYLALALGLGVPAAALLLAAVVRLAWICREASDRAGSYAVVPSVAVGSAMLVGVQAFVAPIVNVEAVALTFAALLGAGVGQAFASSEVLLEPSLARRAGVRVMGALPEFDLDSALSSVRPLGAAVDATTQPELEALQRALDAAAGDPKPAAIVPSGPATAEAGAPLERQSPPASPVAPPSGRAEELTQRVIIKPRKPRKPRKPHKRDILRP